MARSSVAFTLCALVVASAACGNKTENKTDPTAAAGKGTAGAPAKAASGDTKGVDWKKVERVPFAKLQGLLPGELEDFKRTNLLGGMTPDDQYPKSEAAGEYESPKEMSVKISIEDNPVFAAEIVPNKTSTFKGHLVTTEQEDDTSCDFTFVVANRFVVTTQGTKVKIARMKALLEKVDLAKLASWKDEGVKK